MENEQNQKKTAKKLFLFILNKLCELKFQYYICIVIFNKSK